MRAIRHAVSALCVVAALSTHAYAADVDQGTWDNGDTYNSCDSGVNTRSCTYDFYAADCTEAAAAGARLPGCSFRVHVAVSVTPILNTAGRVVGCTSVALSAAGYAVYDSAFSQFDNGSIDQAPVFEVKDTFGDGKPGIAKFAYTATNQGELVATRWTATGTFEASCARSARQWTSAGAGTVTVETA